MSLMFTPAVISIARRRGWYDPVDERKIHTDQTPRLGGLAIELSFFISMPVSLIIIEALAPGKVHISASLLVLFSAGIGFHLLGLVDDFKSLGGRIKFVVQIFLAVVIVSAGYYFRVVEIPVAPFRVELGFVGPVLTVIWIVGIVNAMNLIDGMDGLSGGLAIIGAVVWAMVYIKIGQYLPALVALAFTGAILGFLFFNFPPAAVFMGDSGSLFLGFILAILPLLGRIRSPMQTGLLPAITICFIPLLDTLAAIIRRWRRGVSFFTADRYHLHHKFLLSLIIIIHFLNLESLRELELF